MKTARFAREAVVLGVALVIEKMPTESQVLCGRCTSCGVYMRADVFERHVFEDHLDRRKS